MDPITKSAEEIPIHHQAFAVFERAAAATSLFSASMQRPLVSVVVRSFNRVPSLCTLVEALLRQDWADLEIVIVEQSTAAPAGAAARLAELARDPRVVLLRRAPLGGAAARNVGVQQARGEILLFIDDDDLPADERWVSSHVRALEDPRCLGASGRHIHNDDPEHAFSPLMAMLTRTLSYDPILKLSLTYVQHDQRRIPVQAIHGTNASLRRSAWERFGGWDEDTAIEDEVSFCFRALRAMARDEYFAYDPRPAILRNRDTAGGLDKRRMDAAVYFGHYLDFVHRILGRYHPARVVLLYPLYVLTSYFMSVGFLWKNSRRYRTPLSRLGAGLVLLALIPLHMVRALLRLGQPASALGRVAAARGPERAAVTPPRPASNQGA